MLLSKSRTLLSKSEKRYYQKVKHVTIIQ